MGLTMAPEVETTTTTAAHQDQPLFVLCDDATYSVRLESVVPSLRPVAPWTASDFSALETCGSSFLGLLKNSRTVVVHDTVTFAAAPGTRLRSVKRMPAMLSVGDDTVVVMDRVLRRRRDGSSACCFEALRRLPGGSGWRADPLPDAPVQELDDELDDEELEDELDDEELEDELDDEELEDELDDEDYYKYNPVDVSPYFVMGTRLWISVRERGTFSLDLSSGAWQVEGSWQLPVLEHRAFFVPELGCAVGLVPGYDYDSRHCQVCAIDVVEAQKDHRPPVVRHVWKFPMEHANGVPPGDMISFPPGDMISFTYHGNGTFCMARCVIVDRYMRRGTSFTLLDLDFTSLPGAEGGPQLVKRGEPHIHAWPPGWSGLAFPF